MHNSEDSFSNCTLEEDSSESVEVPVRTIEFAVTPGEAQEVVRNISILKAQVATVNSKLQDTDILLQAKDDENRELREKLRALEVTVLCLNDNAKSNGFGYCSSACQLF